jgi:hypothetical protein
VIPRRHVDAFDFFRDQLDRPDLLAGLLVEREGRVGRRAEDQPLLDDHAVRPWSGSSNFFCQRTSPLEASIACTFEARSCE